jgi:hypothetical protein
MACGLLGAPPTSPPPPPHAAGARAILVPTERTLHDEIDAAPEVARDLPEAIGQLLGAPA